MEMGLRERTALCEIITGAAFVGVRPSECTGLATQTKDNKLSNHSRENLKAYTGS
jgi:hypothetical protein